MIVPRLRVVAWLALGLAGTLGIASAQSGTAEPPGAPDLPAAAAALDPARIDVWREHLRPSAEETAWQRVPWHATFADGLREADARAMPLLVWVMNGHPLGCT